MTEELKSYLEQSRESRKRLYTFANCIHKPQYSESQTEKNLNSPNDFPSLNPKRFNKFKETVHRDLQRMFARPELLEQEESKMRSFSFNQKKVASVYHVSKRISKRVYVLPPISRKKEISVPERLLGGRYGENSIDSIPTISSVKTPKKSLNTRFEVKERLLVPILRRRSSKIIGL